MAELRHHPYRSRLITLEEEIRRVRFYAEIAEKADSLSKPVTVPLGMLKYLRLAADVLEEELPEDADDDQDLPRYGMYL